MKMPLRALPAILSEMHSALINGSRSLPGSAVFDRVQLNMRRFIDLIPNWSNWILKEGRPAVSWEPPGLLIDPVRCQMLRR